jgi:hypothetical protein
MLRPVVDMGFFGSLSDEKIAVVLGVAFATGKDIGRTQGPICSK